jgi:hypothetical protein
MLSQRLRNGRRRFSFAGRPGSGGAFEKLAYRPDGPQGFVGEMKAEHGDRFPRGVRGGFVPPGFALIAEVGITGLIEAKFVVFLWIFAAVPAEVPWRSGAGAL